MSNTYIGKLQKVGCYELPSPSTFTVKGKQITNTHRLSVQTEDGDYIGFGNCSQDSFLVKDDDGNWRVLGAGSEVVIKYTTKTDKNGKVHKNAKRSDMIITNFVEGQAYGNDSGATSNNNSSASGGTKGGGKGGYDVKGNIKGHALKCAVKLLGRFKKGDLLTYGREALEASKKLKEELVSKGVSDFTAGQTAGACVYNACEIVGSGKPIYDTAHKLCFEYDPQFEKLVEEVYPEHRPEPKKEEAAPQGGQELLADQAESTEAVDDWDEDIPF